jgi:phosphoesterase RecJ-like protein
MFFKNKSILSVSPAMAKAFQGIYKQILKFDHIIVFRHKIPDFDALGTQMGLVTWLQENFPKKTIRYVGDDHVTFTPRLYPKMEVIDDAWFAEPFLALIVDTANKERISDARYEKAAFKVKIDHHPNLEPYGDIVVVDTTFCAASELVVNMLHHFPKKHRLNALSAKYFYTGIAGDSGRFLYSSTTGRTFEIAKMLLATGIKLSKEVYTPMYQKQLDDLKVTAYILNNFKVSPNGVAYYVLSDDIQKTLKITAERGKENVNQFANIEGIHAWCSITEDPKDKVWRVSIRSKEKAINGVAAQFEGGGHAQASGAKLNSLLDLEKLIQALDALF